MIAGEIKWIESIEANQTITIPITINMLTLGYHDAIVHMHGSDAIVTARFRQINDINVRNDMLKVCKKSPEWFSVHVEAV
jgi:hypothetical protein